MNWGVLGPYATAAVSVIVAILAHLRATQAQKEQTEIDRTALINDAYQDILSELRAEVDRAHTALVEERGKYLEHRQYCTSKIRDLEDELHEEREQRIRLETEVRRLEQDMAKVEKRRPRPDEGEADGST